MYNFKELEKLTTHSLPDIKKAASGALWNISGNTKSPDDLVKKHDDVLSMSKLKVNLT